MTNPLLTLTATKSLLLDATASPVSFSLFWNPRFLSGISVVASAYLCAFAYRKKRDETSPNEQGVLWSLYLIAHSFTLIFVSCDLWQYAETHWTAGGRGNAPQLAMSIFWTVYAVTGVCFGIIQRNRQVRLFAMGLLYLSVLKVFVFDLSGLEGVYRIASFFTLGVILLLVSLLYTRFETQMRGEALTGL